jgi:hypothetical protein
MDRFVRLPGQERRRYFEQTAERMGLSPQIIEKDFYLPCRTWEICSFLRGAPRCPKPID